MIRKRLAIIGASGLVGQTVLKVLVEEKLWNKFDIYLISSDRTAGKQMIFNGEIFRLLKLDETIFKFNFDYAIFSAGDDVSKIWVPKFADKQITVIDNSNAFRRLNNVPLVVPEINFSEKLINQKIISNPNCSTIQLALVLYRLINKKIKKVIVSSYQSVSGAGKDALTDLENGTNNFFERGIKDNIIAQIGNIEDNNFCTEENKIMFETNKILESNFKVFATTVRVPIKYCHGESVYVEFCDNIDLDEFKKCLKCENIVISEDVILPYSVANTNLTYVFRIRQMSNTEIMFFILADNLRRGAAYNAVLILKKLLNNNSKSELK